MVVSGWWIVAGSRKAEVCRAEDEFCSKSVKFARRGWWFRGEGIRADHESSETDTNWFTT